MSLQRKPNYNKRLMENSNLQQIVEWQETNSSTITNEINSEPFKCLDGNSQAAKTVSLTTETTLANKGNERTIETKSKAVRKFDKDPEKENQSNKSNDQNEATGKEKPAKDREEEETSFNPPASSKCNKCDHEIKKKSSSKSSRSKRDATTEQKMKNYEEKFSREGYREERSNREGYREERSRQAGYREEKSGGNGNGYRDEYGDPKRSVCVKNVNLDQYLLPSDLFSPLLDYKRLSGDGYLKSYTMTDTVGSEKANQQNDNLSKLSFDSGHSSSMSSISYQNKTNGVNGQTMSQTIDQTIGQTIGQTMGQTMGQERPIQESNLDESLDDNLDDLNDDLNPLNSTDLADEESEIRLDPVPANDELCAESNELSLVAPSIAEFSKSLVPQLRSANLFRNTEIINRITKTVYPESIKKKTIKKKKFVFEQQLNSPSADQEQNDCKISSLITMEIPCNLRRKSRCSKCQKSRKISKFKETATAGEETATSEYYEATSFNPELEPDRYTATSLSSTCSSSETDSLFNEEDLNTLTKFQKFKPVLIDQDDDQTTWEYSLECNCLNGVNASVK